MSLAVTKRNLPHVVSNLSNLEPAPVLNGLFRFMNKAQANNVNGSHKYHQIQPVTTVSTSAFTSTNYFFDFNLPMNVDMIDDEQLEITLKNTDAATDWNAEASVPFWFQRIEIRHDGEIKQTIRDLHLYLDNTMYQDDFARAKLEPSTGIDTSTYQAKSSVLQVDANSTATFRLRLNSIISKCNLYLKGLKGQLVVRVYPQTISRFSSSAVNSSIQLQTATLLLREFTLTPEASSRLEVIHRSNVDYRYVDVIHEETVLSLTANALTKYVTNNFHDQLYSHLVVLTRTSNCSLGALEEFLDQTSVYIEDVAGMNLSNGIQWTDEQLRKVVYVANFPNTMALQPNMNIYVPKSPSLNPELSYKRGVNNGSEVLPRNAKVCIVPATTASRQVDILCYAYFHLRVEGGRINIY